MPALVAGIHVLKIVKFKDVDGRDKPGHDGVAQRRYRATRLCGYAMMSGVS
jgi:hypothetical protein